MWYNLEENNYFFLAMDFILRQAWMLIPSHQVLGEWLKLPAEGQFASGAQTMLVITDIAKLLVLLLLYFWRL